jgi:hypothetical protein
MIPDGEYTAVVDRIEDTFATLELSDEAGERYNLVVGEEELPADARHADATLQVTLSDDELIDTMYQPAETEARKQDAQDRFDRLSSRAPRDEDETDDAE